MGIVKKIMRERTEATRGRHNSIFKEPVKRPEQVYAAQTAGPDAPPLWNVNKHRSVLPSLAVCLSLFPRTSGASISMTESRRVKQTNCWLSQCLFLETLFKSIQNKPLKKCLTFNMPHSPCNYSNPFRYHGNLHVYFRVHTICLFQAQSVIFFLSTRRDVANQQ